MLNAGQCQNDIWLDGIDPFNPVVGNIRLIFQSDPVLLFVYAEQFVGPTHNDWDVINMPPGIAATAPSLPPPNNMAVAMWAHIPVNATAQALPGGVVQGFAFLWTTVLNMTGPAAGLAHRLKYIRHEPRQIGEQYLEPMIGSPVVDVTQINWGRQVNLYRYVTA